jgi:hypothetical protein
VYYGLLILFFALGFFTLAKRRAALVIFFMLAGALPTARAFGDAVLKNQIFFFESFFVGALIAVLVKFDQFRVPKAVKFAMLVLGLVLFYTLISGLFINHIDKYALRDLRLSLSLILPSVLLILVYNSQAISLKTIGWIAIFSGAGNTFLVVLLRLGYIHVGNDYYDVENNFRYSGLGTYLDVIYLIVCLQNSKVFVREAGRLNVYLGIALSGAGMLVAGYRMLILAVILGLLAGSANSMKKLLVNAGLGAVAASSFIAYSLYFDVGRVTQASNLGSIWDQLMTRYSPAMDYLNNLTILTTIFGFGYGTTFFIGWFDYQGLDSYLNNIDTTYVTMFVKMGMLSSIYIVAFVWLFVSGHKRSTGISLVAFLLVYMITVAVTYHATFSVAIGYCAACAITLRRLEMQKQAALRTAIVNRLVPAQEAMA